MSKARQPQRGCLVKPGVAATWERLPRVGPDEWFPTPKRVASVGPEGGEPDHPIVGPEATAFGVGDRRGMIPGVVPPLSDQPRALGGNGVAVEEEETGGRKGSGFFPVKLLERIGAG